MSDAILNWLHQMPDWVERTLAGFGACALLVGGMTFLIALWMPNPKDPYK